MSRFARLVNAKFGDDKPKEQSTESNLAPEPILATVALETTVAPEPTVATETTVAPESPVARETRVVPAAPVVSEPSALYPHATVAPEATVAPDNTVAFNAPVVKGYSSFTNDLLDRVLRTLDTYEQVVLLRLCRLSWGYGVETCRVGYDGLQKACNLKKRKLQETISKLESIGYIKRLSLEQGGSERSERGTTYQILLTPPTGVRRATVAPKVTVASGATVAHSATNKDKYLKETKKKDVSGCPDCGGTNWVYPSDTALGVKRCEHPRLNSVN